MNITMKNKLNTIKHSLSRLLKNDAMSSTISLMLVLMIFFSATGAVLLWGPQYIEREESKYQTMATVSQYNSIVEVLNSLIAGGNGSSSTSDIVINDGSIEIDSKGEKIIIAYSFNQNWDFNTSLDDNNKNLLEIIMTNGQIVDNVTIYWLEDTCFLAGTKITMADGSLKNIEDIGEGDVVRSYDDVSGSFVDSRVKKLLSYNKDRMTDYYVVINDELRVTPNHRLFVNDRWVEAGKLSVGDVLFDVAGRKISLFSIEKRFSKELSFDLLLESDNAYFADGFLVRSDVEKIVVSDNVFISKMSVASVKLSPLGEESTPPPTSWHYHPEEYNSTENSQFTNDTYLSNRYPTLNYGDEVYMLVDPMRPLLNRLNRALVYTSFSESDIPEFSYIIDAGLNLRYYSVEGAFTGWPRQHDVYECANTWTERDPIGADWTSEEFNFRESDPGVLDSVSITRAGFGWKEWDVTSSIQDFVGYSYGSNPVVLQYGHYEDYQGWYIKDADEDVGTSQHTVKYRSREYDSPFMLVSFIAPPTIETWNPTGIGTDSATLEGKLSYDGGEASDCYFRWGYGSLSYTTSKSTSRYDYSDSALISISIINLNSGDLVEYKAYAENSAYSNGYGSIVEFITIPPSPTNLEEASTGSGPNKIKVVWDEGAVEGSGQNVYTKVLCKEGSYPTYDEDVKFWRGPQEYHTFYDLDEDTCYYFSAYTNVTEDGLWQRNNVPDQCIICTSSNSPPDTPSTPTGDTPVDVGISHMYETVATDPEGDLISYRFNWNASGVDDYSSWSSWVPSGTPVSMSHSWSFPGVYEVEAQAKDSDTPPFSIWSSALTVTVNPIADTPPSVVLTPNFEGNLSIGESGEFQLLVKDPESDQIQYRINWDVDGTSDITDWSVLSDPGTFFESHSWPSSGIYNVSAQARAPSGGGEGAWSDKCQVNVTGVIGKPDTLDLLYSIYYNDTSYFFELIATEDDVKYKFDFGDEFGVTPWFGPYNTGDTVEADHAWSEKGVYEVRVKAKKDATSFETEWSDPQALRVLYKYVVPPDIREEPEKVSPDSPESNTFTANQDLVGAVCIHLFNDSYPPLANSVDKGKIPFGVIYLFDLGSIVHRIPSASGEHKTLLQSGGVMTVLPGGAHIDSYSNIYENGDILGFTVTMIRADNIIAGSGAGTYGLTFENQNTFTREQQGYDVYNFKVKFSGEYSSTWHEYLARNFKFDSQSGQFSDFLVYDNHVGKQLVFSTALIKADLQ